MDNKPLLHQPRDSILHGNGNDWSQRIRNQGIRINNCALNFISTSRCFNSMTLKFQMWALIKIIRGIQVPKTLENVVWKTKGRSSDTSEPLP